MWLLSPIREGSLVFCECFFVELQFSWVLDVSLSWNDGEKPVKEVNGENSTMFKTKGRNGSWT